jgi:hypothetical protein
MGRFSAESGVNLQPKPRSRDLGAQLCELLHVPHPFAGGHDLLFSLPAFDTLPAHWPYNKI